MNNPLQLLSELERNPIEFIIKRGFNLPNNIDANPNAIIQHLMNTGQISQDQYNNVVKQAQNMGFKH